MTDETPKGPSKGSRWKSTDGYIGTTQHTEDGKYWFFTYENLPDSVWVPMDTPPHREGWTRLPDVP
jgi:hypothetical protein